MLHYFRMNRVYTRTGYGLNINVYLKKEEIQKCQLINL